MALESGEYAPRNVRRVVVWPKADRNGDGSALWETKLDEQGRQVDRVRVRDSEGHEISDYRAPEGFVNKPSYTHQDNWVYCDDRGDVVRQPNGDAISLKPGQGVVFLPDGSVEYLTDEYAQYQFANAHDKVGDESQPEEDAIPLPDVESKDDAISRLEKQLAELRGVS